MTTTRRRARPAWLWPVLVAFALVPIGTAIGLFAASRGKPAEASPASSAPAPTHVASRASATSQPDAGSTIEASTSADTTTPEAPETAPEATPNDVISDIVEVGDPRDIGDDIGAETAIAAVVDDVRSEAPPRPERPIAEPNPEPAPVVAGDQGTGEVIVRARPWALITIGGKSMGMTPGSFQLPPGHHTVTLTKGESKHSTRVHVVRGRATLVEHDFGRGQ